MKKLSAMLLSALLLAGCSSATTTTTTEATATEQPTATEATTEVATTSYVDTYTGASKTKVFLDEAGAKEALELLATVDSDLASKADTEAEGYVAPEGETTPQVMSVNPDGSVGLSTIHAWLVNPEANTVEMELTYGQNALNLSEVGDRGSLLCKANDTYYLLHLDVTAVDELKYSDEAYEAGEFNSSYSGAEAQLSEYHITCNILSVEQINLLLLF